MPIQPGALAYHDLTPDGLPVSKVFVRTTLKDGELVSVSASHELVEMLVDPGINLMTTGPDSQDGLCVRELPTRLESLTFPVNNIPMKRFRLSIVFRRLSQGWIGQVRPDGQSQEAF